MTQLTQLRRTGLFGARAPRYTSYPAANHFTGGIGPGDTDLWLRSVAPGSAVSLYVHIPFCRRLCWFCACRTQGTQTLRPVEAYVETLLIELDMIAARLPEGVRLSRLHLGGGTPTLMSPDMIRRLAGAIGDRFAAAEGAEISVEIDPTEVDGARIAALAEMGMNRASIGVQDFNPEIQQTIGRAQSYEQTLDAVRGLRDAGVSNLNVDMLYGLPGQTASRMIESTRQVISLGPERVALYGYAHVPWMAKRQVMIPSEKLPSPEARLALFETARQLFAAAGYEQIGIDHFARPGDGLQRAAAAGTLRRNFQGYTDDQAEVLIGVGASAISRYPQGYAQNAPATSAYQAAMQEGRLATARGHAFSADDRLRAAVIEDILCDRASEIGRVAARSGASPREVEAVFDEAAAAYPEFVSVAGGRLSVALEGRPLIRMIAQSVDAYAAPEGAHSLAV